jgi:GntR family transcriptional regulator, rspAB operon transcriptional repressor
MPRPSPVLASTLQDLAGLEGVRTVSVRGGASGQIVAVLRKAIVNGDLAPGVALNETDVAENFSVSRTPVREAFRVLQNEGLLDVVPQKGTFVSRLQRSRLRDALFVREALECAAVRLAARAPQEQRLLLQRIVDRQRQALLHGDTEASLQADEDLHRTIMELSAHGTAWEIVRQARLHLDRLRRLATRELKGSEEALQHHEQIADAVSRGDAAASEKLLRNHIGQIEGFIDRLAEIHSEYIE